MIARLLPAVSRRHSVALLIVAVALAFGVLVATGAGGTVFTRNISSIATIVTAVAASAA